MASIVGRGCRMFTAASALIVIVAILHLGGLANDSAEGDWGGAIDAMKSASVQAGPFTMTLYGVFEGVWIQLSALLVLIALTNVLAVALVPKTSAPRIARALSVLDCVAFASLAGLFLYYQIPPPLISFAVLSLAFLVAALLSGRAIAAPPQSGTNDG